MVLRALLLALREFHFSILMASASTHDEQDWIGRWEVLYIPSERWSIFRISTIRYSRGPPTYSSALNDTRTIHCSSRGDGSSTGLMVRYHPTRGLVVTTKQTSQVTFLEAHHLTNRSQCPVLRLGNSKHQSMLTFCCCLEMYSINFI
jgi:hypothetical protein